MACLLTAASAVRHQLVRKLIVGQPQAFPVEEFQSCGQAIRASAISPQFTRRLEFKGQEMHSSQADPLLETQAVINRGNENSINRWSLTSEVLVDDPRLIPDSLIVSRRL